MSVWRAEDVYLTELLAAVNGQQAAYGRFFVRSVQLENRRYERSLMTDVSNRSDDSSVTLIVPVERRFKTFRATVGRDPSETAAGPGCVYFEVWGDERRLFQSPALRSPVHLVKVPPGVGGKIRRNPQDIDVSLKGVETLRLVTRYADDFVQQAAQVERGRGCVWGDPRLEPDGDGAKAPGQEEPLRDALRGPTLRLAVSVTTVPLMLPLKVAVAPLRQEGMLVLGPPEPALRAVLTDLLGAARRGGETLFTLQGRRDSDRFAAAFPARRSPVSDPDETKALTEAGKRANVDVVLSGVYTPSAAGRPGQLRLSLWDVRSGTRLGNQVAMLPAPVRR